MMKTSRQASQADWPYLSREWDAERNGGPAPKQMAPGSNAAVWWKCSHGHSWKCRIRDRLLGGTGCPCCAGKIPVLGVNDLETLRPEVAKEWDGEKNGGLRPEDFTVGSQRKVWWKCERGHEWEATIENRALKGNRCPYCTGKKAWPGFNDLETLFPELMKEWHPVLNRKLDPRRLRPGSRRRVSWICERGHVWDTYLFSRTDGKEHGCPYCMKEGRRFNGQKNG